MHHDDGVIAGIGQEDVGGLPRNGHGDPAAVARGRRSGAGVDSVFHMGMFAPVRGVEDAQVASVIQQNQVFAMGIETVVVQGNVGPFRPVQLFGIAILRMDDENPVARIGHEVRQLMVAVKAADPLAASQAQGGVVHVLGGEGLAVLVDDKDAVTAAEHGIVFIGAGAVQARAVQVDGVFPVIVIVMLVIDVHLFRQAVGRGAVGRQQNVTTGFGDAVVGTVQGLAGHTATIFQGRIREQFYSGHDGVAGIAIVKQSRLFAVDPIVGGGGPVQGASH